MRVLVIFAILALSCVYSAQSHTVVPIPFSRIIPRATCTDDDKNKEYCSADCRSIVYCNNNAQEETTNCLASTGKPYCEKLSEKAAQCTTESAGCISFTDTCPSDGIFPNLLDCTKYVYCVGPTSTPAECDANKVYHGGDKMCKSGVQCYNYDSLKGLCRGKDQVRLAYPLNPKLYVYCSPGGPKLRQCNMDDENIKFDPKQGTCVFVCSKEGLFEDTNDPHYYFECAKVGNGFQTTRKKCPDDTIFDKDKEQCKAAR
ncbi:hypothetical protein CBL_12002 [Carabus blaptoides fortunei]